MNWFECEACESDAEHQRICLVLESEPWSKNDLFAAYRKARRENEVI